MNFSQYDKHFFRTLRRLVKLKISKETLSLHQAFHNWYDNVLKPFNTSKIPQGIEASISNDQKHFTKIFKKGENLKKEQRQNNLEQCAKDRISNVFGAITKRELKRMFDVWKAMNSDFNHRRNLLKSIALRKEKNLLNTAVNEWRKITNQTIQNFKFNFYINEMPQQQYLQSVFSSFKNVTVAEKHKRLKAMRKIWEALRSETKTQKHFKL